MKRVLAVLLSGLFVMGLGAQTMQPAQTAAAVIKVEGKLSLVNGMIALQAKDKTYYVGGIQRLVGFIDGLKEGAAVKAEGYAVPVPLAPEYSHLRLTKLTFNGKDYDLSQAGGFGMGKGGYGPDAMGRGHDDMMGGGRGGREVGGRGMGGR